MFTERRDDLLPLAILTSIVAFFFFDVLLGANGLYVRDLIHFHHPTKHVLREIVLGGEFPHWNPYFQAGQPMAANPQHEVFYPLNWLILLPDFDRAFQLLIVLHLEIAGWTMYALLRSMRTSRGASFLGALSFALGGVALSCTTLLPFLFELAWLPLTCLFTRRFLRERQARDFAAAALVFGLQIVIGEPVSILMTGGLLGAYALHRRGHRLRALGGVALIGIAGVAVAAVAVLPAVDHARDSVRADGFPFEVVATWSTPFARAGEIVFPNLFGHHTTDGSDGYWGAALYADRKTPFLPGIYPGLLIATMLLAGLALRARGAALTAAILGASLLFAAGAHTPLWRFLYDVGIVRGIRYPEKFLIAGVFALTVFAARTLDTVLGGEERARVTAVRTTGVIAILAAGASAIALSPLHASVFTSVWHPRASSLLAMLERSRTSWILALLFAVLLGVLLRNVRNVRPRTWLVVATVLVLLDLGLKLPELAPRMPAAYFEAPPLARRLPLERESWRLMHVVEWQNDDDAFRPFTAGPDLYWIRRNALRPMMPARWGIRTVMEADYDKTSLRATNEFVEMAWWLAHVRADWAAVVAPMANARFLGTYDDPRAALRRAGGDRRVVEPVRLIPLGDHPRYRFATRLEPYRDFRSLAARLASAKPDPGRAFIREADAAALSREWQDTPLPAPGIVRSVRETANSAVLDVETRGPAFLVISVTPHKYWRVTVDGAGAMPLVTNLGFQGIAVPGGRHRVEMRYRNPLIAAGGAISVAALLALGWVVVRMRPL